MQHDPRRTSPVCFFCERRPSLISTCNIPPQNFAETLPTEMSVKIFGELDAESLCSASRTCKLWHDIIEESDQLWRRQCLLVRAVCQREVDSDRRDGLSWKASIVLALCGIPPLSKTPEGLCGLENVTRASIDIVVTLVKNYTRSCLKRDWLRGRYSNVRSAEELIGRKMTPLDAETWGEILQAELDR